MVPQTGDETTQKELGEVYKWGGQKIKIFLLKNCVWHRFGEVNEMITSSACEILIHLQRFTLRRCRQIYLEFLMNYP